MYKFIAILGFEMVRARNLKLIVARSDLTMLTVSGIGICKLCTLREATCKAHIIPRQFYHRIRQGSPHLLEFEVGEQIAKRTTQSGIWEKGILCPECDNELGQYDNYAYQVLPELPDKCSFIDAGNGIQGYSVGLINVERFRLFLVSLVWRAGISSQGLFERVDIGPYEERLRKILLGGATPEDAESVNAAILLYRPRKYDSVLLPPVSFKLEGVNVVQFYLYPWKLILKLDRRQFAPPMDAIALKSGVATTALVQDFYTLAEVQILSDLKKRVASLPP